MKREKKDINGRFCFYALTYKKWKFIIDEIVWWDTDYVFRVYIEHDMIFWDSWNGRLEFAKDYKSVWSAKRAVTMFIKGNLS